MGLDFLFVGFYYHYSDIPTLLEEILIEKADAIFKPEINGNICGCMTAAVRVALENKNAVMHIFNSANRESFERSLDRMAERAVSNCIDFYAAVYTISDECREAVLLYYKSLLVGFAIDYYIMARKPTNKKSSPKIELDEKIL